MAIWNSSRMLTVYYAAFPSSERRCVVKMTDQEILVEYQDDGTWQYRGIAKGEGHFELSCPELQGKASLHMFSGSLVLEGSWVQDGERGMWCIQLG